MIKTFISHTSSDHQFVEWLKTKLEKENFGLDIFVDDGLLFVGDNPQKMIDEVKKSIIFLPILSNESIQKEFVQNEIKTAFVNNTTYVFPIKLKCDDASIPKKFKIEFNKYDKVEGKIYEDFSSEQEWDIHYENLCRAISNKIIELGLFKEDTKDFYQDCEHLDLIVQRDEPTTLELKMVVDIYLKKEKYQRYFFTKLTNISWLKYLKLYGYLRSNPQPIEDVDSPGLFRIPQWDALVYLERVSSQAEISDEVIDDLFHIIKSVTNLKDESGKYIDNYRTWYYFTKILLNLPNEKITEEIVNLIPIWLDSKFNISLQGSEIATKLLPKFLTNNPKDIKKAEKIIKYITMFKSVPLSEERAKYFDRNEEYRLVIDPYWLKEAFAKYAVIIGEKCTTKVIEDLTERIKTLLRKKEDGTYTSFYDEPEYSIADPLDTFTFILKRILNSKAKSNISASEEILERFFQDEYLYFPKMALYIFGQNIDSYKELFWKLFSKENGELVVANTLYCGDELKHLLENLKNLTDEQRGIINEKIENTVKNRDFKEDPEEHSALCKQKIYSALSHDLYFRNLYENMKGITKVDAALHPAVGKVEVFHGPGPSPITREEVLKMTNDELAEYLTKFKAENLLEGPTIEGLADLIGEVAKEIPGKFVENLSPFKDIDYIYIYEIFSGIKDAWNEKKNIDWQKIFEFVQLYANREKFKKADRQWVAGTIAELIQDGARDDAWAFPEQYFKKSEEIIFLLLANLKSKDDEEVTDYTTYTLNTAFGKVIIALILLALRIARVHGKKEPENDIKWSTETKEKYEWIVNNKIIEGYNCLGRYLPNFYYLDKEWSREKIKFLEKEKDSKYCEAFMDGYLSIGKVYDDLYSSMRPHYQNGIGYDFKEKHDNEYLIQHISIAYLKEHESLDEPESLFKQILDKFEYNKIKEIINFFWMQRAYLSKQSETSEKIREKIIEFWRWLYEKYKSNTILSAEDRKIISYTAELAVILPEINEENSKWLMLAAQYIHEDLSSFFIEYLDELKDKGDRSETTKYIGDIYLKMLEKIMPNFDQKHIRSIVEFLYNANATDSANKICNRYGEKGYEFLEDIYKKHYRD